MASLSEGENDMSGNIFGFKKSYKCPKCDLLDTTAFDHGKGRFFFNCNKCEEKTEITDDNNAT